RLCAAAAANKYEKEQNARFYRSRHHRNSSSRIMAGFWACEAKSSLRLQPEVFQYMRALFSLGLLSLAGSAVAQSVDWPRVGNDPGAMRYSTLTQVNRKNVAKLQVAWTYHTGDSSPGSTIECTPIVIDGTMYVTTVRGSVVALDAATGKEKW